MFGRLGPVQVAILEALGAAGWDGMRLYELYVKLDRWNHCQKKELRRSLYRLEQRGLVIGGGTKRWYITPPGRQWLRQAHGYRATGGESES